MNALAFDTLAYARRLELAGFSRQQAEALAEEQAKLIDERLATKADIAAVRGDIEALRLTTKSDLRETELRLESRIEATKAETLKWLVGSMGIQTVVIIGAVVALVRAAGH